MPPRSAPAERSGGTDEAVIDRVTGLLVDGSSVDDVVDAAIQLLCNPDVSAAMGRAGRRRAERRFAWPRLSFRFAGVLRDGQHGPKPGQDPGSLTSSRERSSCTCAASAIPPYRAHWALMEV